MATAFWSPAAMAGFIARRWPSCIEVIVRQCAFTRALYAATGEAFVRAAAPETKRRTARGGARPEGAHLHRKDEGAAVYPPNARDPISSVFRGMRKVTGCSSAPGASRTEREPVQPARAPAPDRLDLERQRRRHVNLAPFSFFNAVAYVPPQVMFATTGPHRAAVPRTRSRTSGRRASSSRIWRPGSSARR